MFIGDGATDGVAHLIQTALTPVFLLSGIGQLLQVFNARVAGVFDHLRQTAELLRTEPCLTEKESLRNHFKRYSQRLWLLNAAIALGAIGGGSTCGAAFVLFLGSVRMSAVAGWLIGLFALALGCTVISLVIFLGDSVLAWHGLRREGPLPSSIKPTAQ
jgi:hypothetical protein